MQTSNNYYLNNPLIHKDRQLAKSNSEWVRSFSCKDLKPLIICRGPIRKEAMDVFDEMGINGYGILLSEKDSITYTNALAPELRTLTDPDRVHRVPDYTGATKEERNKRIQQIIRIAHDNGYNAIFAGYGFMSEDADMVEAMELKVPLIATSDNQADFFTKPLPPKTFYRLRALIMNERVR